MSASADVIPPTAIPPDSDPTAIQIIGKRKRVDEAESPSAAVLTTDHAQVDSERERQFQLMLFDLLELLKSCDTKPSVLEHPFSPATVRSPKRSKSSNSSESVVTISSRIRSHAYASIDEVTSDLGAVIADLVAEDDGARREQFISFNAFYQSLILGQAVQAPQSLGLAPSEQDVIKNEDDDTLEYSSNKAQADQAVLTLFGGQPGARQLFSSLRKAPSEGSRVKGPVGSTENLVLDDILPNGISTTSIVPVHSIGGDEKAKKVPTLGELCPAPPGLAALGPPRQSTHHTTRGQSVNWYKPPRFPTPQTRPGGRESFSNQVLSAGQWLSYNVMPPASPQSSGEKRKQRDRALSTGETHPAQSPEDLERVNMSQQIHQQARDAALFKSVYSSFAPSHDNSGSVVTEQLRSKLWWRRFCERRLEWEAEYEDSDAFESHDVEGVDSLANGEDDESMLFEEAVQTFEEDKVEPTNLMDASKAAEEAKAAKDTEEILEEISKLLETLNSYQDVRNLSLTTKTQTSVGQNKPLAELSGSPTSPSSAELDVYTMLRNQLALMISSLPPYAVAKIGGDPLGDLNISTKMRVESPYHSGLLVDEVKLAQPPMNGATGSVMRSQGVPSRHPSYQSTVSTPTHRGSYSAARPGASSYQSTRPPSSSNNYTAYSQQPTHRQSYTPLGQAPVTAQTIQYSSGARPVQSSTSFSSFNTPPTTPLNIRSSQYQRASQPGYQQRPPVATSYGPNYSVAGVRNNSSQNQASAYTPQAPRTLLATPNEASSQRSQYHQAQSSSGVPLPPPAAGTVGQHLHLTAEEQAMLMDRQKKQLAQQNPNGVVSQAPSH